MPKSNRKRKQKISQDDVTYEIMAPKNKFKPFTEQSQAEEEQLSKVLFGGPSSFLRNLENVEQEGTSRKNVNTDSGVGEEDSDGEDIKCRKPAWVDDDDGIDVGYALNVQGRKLPNGGVNSRSNQYVNLLQHKFVSVMGNPKWASLEKHDYNSDSDDEILQTTGFIKSSAKQNLPPTTLEYKKVKDLNCETYNEGIINSVEFHPTSSVALVAGHHGIATLFAVDGKQNSKLHSVAFDRYSILNAKFSCDGNEAILGSRHKYIYSYDLMAAKATKIQLPNGLHQCKYFVMSPDSRYIAIAGKWGEVFLLSAHSKEKIHVLKQNNEVTALTFNVDSSLLFGHSDNGEVTVWDMKKMCVKHKWFDEGSIQGTTIDISSSGQFIATGSAQGVVNLYDFNQVMLQSSPSPRKTLFNLTTGISNLKFDNSSESLTFASSDLESSIRILHVGSGTVFSNFPTFGIKLGHITSLNYSPNSGYLALGNKKSIVSLYRLKHFKNY